MGLTVEWAPYGRGAAEALRAVLRAAKGDDPLAPVTVVVPSNHVGVASRRLLASNALGPLSGRGRGLVAVDFLTVYRLAELHGAATLAAAGRRPVSTPLITAALRAALAEQPGTFAPVAGHPATEAALAGAYRELRDVTPPALAALARTGPRAADVVRLYERAHQLLAPSFYDEQDLLVAATGTWTTTGPVVVYLPQLLTLHAAALFRTIATVAPVTVVAGSTGAPGADAEVGVTLQRLGATRHQLTSPQRSGAVPLQTVGRAHVVSASDADEEVRAAVRAVLDRARAGTPLDRIAVLYAQREPYARLVAEQLAAAAVATNGAAVAPVTERAAARWLLQLLDLAARGYRRQDVAAWFASVPLQAHGEQVPAAAWDRLSREAGVLAGPEQWDVRLAELADRAEGAANAAARADDGGEGTGRAERLRLDAVNARRLRAFMVELIGSLEAAGRAELAWSQRAAWAGELLAVHLGGPAQRASWPASERGGAERVEAALRRLAQLDAVEPVTTLTAFTNTLRAELEDDLGRHGRLGEGVITGPISLATGLDLDLVVVLGLVEGRYPTPLRDDGLLPDHERAVTGGELRLRAERLSRQHRELLAACAAAPSQWLGVPRGDLRHSTAHLPSRWLVELVAAAAGEPVSSAQLLAPSSRWATHVASFDAGLRATALPATAQEHRLAAQQQGRSVPDPVLDRGAAMLAARRSSRFTNFDGNLAGLTVPSPTSGVTFATRLERWASCPFAYLQGHLLGLEPVTNPEDRLTISPLDRGDIVHLALERFLADVLAEQPSSLPEPSEPWQQDHAQRLAAIADRYCQVYEAQGRVGRPLFWGRERKAILANLRRFLHADDARRAEHQVRPVAAELTFGFGRDSAEAVGLALPDGRQVRFGGKADRVDIGVDGTVHVVDYKTGRRNGFSDLNEASPDLGGRKLQLAVYGAAARQHLGGPATPVRADYWFVTAREQFKTVGYRVTDEVLAKVGSTLAVIVEGIEAGVFPMHPTAVASSPFVECPYCDPDGLGVADLRRQWEHKRGDPALGSYARLSEPNACGPEPDTLHPCEANGG